MITDLNYITSGCVDLGINSNNVTFTRTDMAVKAEAAQLYIESETWQQVDHNGKLLEPEDTSEDWKITPIDVIDPKLHEEWKKARLWMMDPLDDVLGDDAMLALCGSCNGVYWGDQMMSIIRTITRLRAKHNGSINGMLGSVWEETEPHVLRKLRLNRICKKCYTVSMEARANPYHEHYGEFAPVQMNLPFNKIGGSIPNLQISGTAPVQGDWSITYHSDNDIADCVSDTFIENTNEDDI